MNSALVDSHTLIWLVFEPNRIGVGARQVLLKAAKTHVSLVSLWELAITYNKGKLAYAPEELLDGTRALGAELLAVKPEHILGLGTIATHQDPFDRMLMAQALSEKMTFVTADTEILKLGLPYVLDVRK